LIERQTQFQKWLDIFEESEGGLLNLSKSYEKYGLQRQDNGDITYLEWAPGALSLSIFGDFNNWNREQYLCVKNSFGQFSITLKAIDGESII